jgi:hypothetical protein
MNRRLGAGQGGHDRILRSGCLTRQGAAGDTVATQVQT